MATHSTLRSRLVSLALLSAVATLLIATIGARAAKADLDVTAFDGITAANGAGDLHTAAGGHPFDITTVIRIKNHELSPPPAPGFLYPDASVKDFLVDLPPGFIGNPTSIPTCSNVALAVTHLAGFGEPGGCPLQSMIGVIKLNFIFSDTFITVPLFNVDPATGEAARFAFDWVGTVVVLSAHVRGEGASTHLAVDSTNITQALPLIGSDVVFWGNPSSSVHDVDRCYGTAFGGSIPSLESPYCKGEPGELGGPHSVELSPTPFLTEPTRCSPPGRGEEFQLLADSWEAPGMFTKASYRTHEPSIYPDPPGAEQGLAYCDVVPVDPDIQIAPAADAAETPTGLTVEIDVPHDGFLNPEGVTQSHLKKVMVKLPEGVTINPSAAEGLGVCSKAQFAEESVDPELGGCPDSSKIGTVDVASPALEEHVSGALYLAAPDDPNLAGSENPFDSLVALYIVIRNEQRGIVVKLPGKVEPDEKTGRIIATFDDLPQLPFDTFKLKFREGTRATLVTPPACGVYTSEAEFVPWSAQDPDNPTADEIVRRSSKFEVTRGVGGGPCPQGGVPPFRPGFTAGSINNNAKSYSPFTLRLTRQDGEQDMTKFSAVLPPGVLGKLAGVGKCPDSAIALAKSKTGKQELASPSCPANSQIGRTLAGAGVGSVLTYVPGKVYLGGPYKGDPLSVIAITPIVVGPFDVSTVVVREALTLNPETAEVEVDGAASDPIPHILKGIPAKVRDIRVYVDRDEFILNPTACNPSSAKAVLFGGYLDVFSSADDVPVDLSTRYQAANCLNLGFKPKLSLSLLGGTRRGGHPALRAVLRARPGDANIGKAVVTLPKSAFLDQAHIRTICTRVQFAAKACPKAAQYGYAKAWTPLLDEPIEGPVYLRSSSHKLPDLVAALHGLVDVNVVGRIDSYKGGIRSSFETVPDAPVSKFILSMQGGRKGLVINSRSLCARSSRADVLFTGQNGKPDHFHPLVKASCGKSKRKGHRR